MDRRKIVRCNTQSFGENTEKLPNDLIFEILSKLPAKSVAICRCVSKQWYSLLVSQEFKEPFLKNSLSRPRILFTFRFGTKWHFFSSLEPQKFGDNSSVVATDDYRMASYENWYMESCQSVHGFIYMTFRPKEFTIDRTRVICNPCTGQHITLPNLEPLMGLGWVRVTGLNSFFGYDPIEKQFKVLHATTVSRGSKTVSEFHVLTLGSGELLWRKIKCSFLHTCLRERSLCINGVLYYIARIENSEYDCFNTIVCFDVRYEKFSFIEIEKAWIPLTMINYKGKLGILVYFFDDSLDDTAEIWVLDDINKVKWSKHIFVLPNSGFDEVVSMWATDTGEIVWASRPWIPQFHVFYYNLERQSVRRVEIKGVEEKVWMGQDLYENSFYAFTNHVENLMIL